MASNRVGIVVIGRNEGERLRTALASALGQASACVYADSQSSDGSPELARQIPTSEVYVVTNNHTRGKAPANALMLQSMLAERKVQSPPALYAEYRDALEPFAEPARDAQAARAVSRSADAGT